MKKLFAILFTVCSLSAADLTTVIFSTEQVVGVPLTNTLVEFRPLGLLTWSNRIVPLIPFTNRTDSSGNFTTNFIPGSYRVTIYDRRVDSSFTNSFPESATPIYAADYITVGTNTVAGMAYNQATSLNLFARRTNAIRILTNGVSVAAGYTNLNWSSGVTGYLSGATLTLGVSSAGSSVDTNAFQPASVTLTNLAGTGALTNSAQFVASGSGSASNLNVRSLNGGPSLALLVDTNSLVVTNGRVGIGTNAPGAALDVNGGVAFRGTLRGQSGSEFAITQSGAVPSGNRSVLIFDSGTAAIYSSGRFGFAPSGTDVGGSVDTFIYRAGAGTNAFSATASVPNGSIIASNHIFTGLAHFRTNTVNTPPTAAQIGQGGFIFWNSNGTPWVSRCLDGSTVESKSIF
jgi:hypothetical protein